MRRVTGLMTVLLVVGIVLPSSAAVGDVTGCTATTGAAVSAARGDPDALVVAAPTCGFDMVCAAVGECRWTVRLDVNGTGLVSGRMDAGGRDAGWVDLIAGGFVPGNPPSCGPEAFHCEAGTESGCPGPLSVCALFRAQGPTSFSVRCSGGGVAVVESVTCSMTQVI